MFLVVEVWPGGLSGIILCRPMMAKRSTTYPVVSYSQLFLISTEHKGTAWTYYCTPLYLHTKGSIWRAAKQRWLTNSVTYFEGPSTLIYSIYNGNYTWTKYSIFKEGGEGAMFCHREICSIYLSFGFSIFTTWGLITFYLTPPGILNEIV